jgi:hypothetical protein
MLLRVGAMRQFVTLLNAIHLKRQAINAVQLFHGTILNIYLKTVRNYGPDQSQFNFHYGMRVALDAGH